MNGKSPFLFYTKLYRLTKHIKKSLIRSKKFAIISTFKVE
ncbi:hypothetical protein CF65_00013 [Aggregatibacter actinomycetemcomitans HK1651]|nr:hypothetical protein CF65_00013 [Aggregatibacter actinomycetemcomitans HK1651]